MPSVIFTECESHRRWITT